MPVPPLAIADLAVPMLENLLPRDMLIVEVINLNI
jgi:hypothetical protein